MQMYKMYLDGVVFPVAPSKIKTKIKNNNTTLDLISGSQINLLSLPGLTEISFEALLPHVKYPFAFYEGEFLPPTYYLSLLERLKVGRQPFDFEIRRGGEKSDTLMSVSLEDYTIKEDAEDGNDFTVEIKLREYREHLTKVIEITSGGEAVAKEAVEEQKSAEGTQYTVQKGDTLWKIAKLNYENGARWKEIYQNNQDAIERAARNAGRGDSLGGNLIFPGTVLRL